MKKYFIYLFLFNFTILFSVDIKKIVDNYREATFEIGERIMVPFFKLLNTSGERNLNGTIKLDLLNPVVKKYFLSLCKRYEEIHEGCGGSSDMIRNCLEYPHTRLCGILKEEKEDKEKIKFLLNAINISFFSDYLDNFIEVDKDISSIHFSIEKFNGFYNHVISVEDNKIIFDLNKFNENFQNSEEYAKLKKQLNRQKELELTEKKINISAGFFGINFILGAGMYSYGLVKMLRHIIKNLPLALLITPKIIQFVSLKKRLLSIDMGFIRKLGVFSLSEINYLEGLIFPNKLISYSCIPLVFSMTVIFYADKQIDRKRKLQQSAFY